MSNTLVYDEALTDKNYAAMAAGSDPEPVEQPVATGDVTSHSLHAVHTTTTHYIGLPYQDHNYGAPPPPTPPESPSPVPIASPVLTKVNGIFDDPLKLDVKVAIQLPEPVESKDEGVTRCICNFEHDDGYMICCDRCCVWQHVDCMGLERDSIPETFYCEKCQPREVDKQRAIALQSKKRAAMSDDSSTDSGDEVCPAVPTGNAATYTAISNSPTSLTLTTHNKHKKMKKKKKKRCKEKEDDKKHHKRKKKHHSKKCNKSEESTTAAPIELDIMNEEAVPAWSDSETMHDRYEEADRNQYSADIQHIISSQNTKEPSQVPPPSGRRSPPFPLVNLSQLGKSGACGIMAADNLRGNDFIVEYWGKVMLKEQMDGENPFFKRLYPHVLFYSKFNNVDICVDARNYGNVARFVRRSCSPNAEVRHYVENNVLHFCLFALFNIAKKTEVTIGFDYNYTESSSTVQCACSKKNCAVKRNMRKQNHQVTKAKNHIGNHLQDTSSLSVGSSLNRKRTVSPLRVSLSAHNAQNQAEPPPRSNGDEPTHQAPDGPDSSPAHPTSSKTPAAQPEASEGSEENREESKPPLASAARKMTREERKMEAILQAFAKMEKTEKRRKEALERTSSSKALPAAAAPPGSGAAVETNATAVAAAAAKAPPEIEEKPEEKEEQPVMTDEEPTVKEEPLPSAASDEATAVEVIALDAIAAVTPVAVVPATAASTALTSTVGSTPTSTRTKSFKGRKRKGARRRSRVNSGASTVSVDFSSHDEESIPPTSSQPAVPTPSASASQVPLLIQTALSPSQAVDQQGMASPVPACSKHFKFPKTKKFFMNEWLNEKAQEASASKPLTIKTEPTDVVTPGHSSPGASIQLGKSGSLLNLRGNLEASFGSAKKRWLRQAMSESTGPVPKAQGPSSNNSGCESPICNGTLSPNPASYPVSPALSPNTSCTTNDLMTPLKKRMLRHSIAEDRVTTTPPPAIAQLEDRLRSQSTPTTPAAVDEMQGLPRVDGSEANLASSTCKPEGGFNGLSLTPRPSTPGLAEPVVSPEGTYDIRRRLLPFPFPLPAKKGMRKSSSVDSGLSVTTPGDFDRSPMSLLPGEKQDPSTTPVKDEGTPVKDEYQAQAEPRSPAVNSEERTLQTCGASAEPDSKRLIDSPAVRRISLERTEDGSSVDAKCEQDRALPSNERASSRLQGGDGGLMPGVSEPPSHLDYSLSASQGSMVSSLQSTQSSLSDLHKSYLSMPDLGHSQQAALLSMSRSASSAELQLSSVARKLDMKADVYSTRRASEEPANQGDAAAPRVRHLSACSVNSSSSADQTDCGQHPLRQSFAEDQMQGNLYSSFASPLKRPPLGTSPDAGSLGQTQPAGAGYNAGQTAVGPPGSSSSGAVPPDQAERREVPQTFLQPLDGPNAADTETPSSEGRLRAQTWSQMPGPPTGPGRPAVASVPPPPPPGAEPQPQPQTQPQPQPQPQLQPDTDEESRPVGYIPMPAGTDEGSLMESGQMGPGRPLIPTQAPFGVSPSPASAPQGAGLTRPAGSPVGPGPPTSGLVSPVPGTPPATKKRVSLLEYRKRKGSDLSNTKPAKKESPSSAPSTPVAPKPAPLKPPLPSPISASSPSTPTKALESPLKAGGSSSPGAQLPSLPLFTTEKENGIGERLSLSTEAQQVISSLTSLLKKHKKPEEEAERESKWGSSKPEEDPLQKMRKELKEKNRERERKEALSHKRPRSPDPPPPPPSKKPNPGLRLQIPPPPPPKTKADIRSGDGDGTPVKMTNPAGNTTPVRTPGSAGIYPQQLGKSFSAPASSPYLQAPVKAPYQQAYQAQQYAQPQQQQQQQQQQTAAQQQPQAQHQAGFNASYPVYDYNHQKTQQQFTQYHQGQQAPLTQQGQYQQQPQQLQPGQQPKKQPGYPYPQAQQQTYSAAGAAPPPPQPPPQPPPPQQQQQYPKISSKFGNKGAFGSDSRTSKAPFPANANSYSPRRGSYYQK